MITVDCHRVKQHDHICPFLSLTEEQQQNRREDHICQLLNERIYHRGKHPVLPPLPGCWYTISEEELLKMLEFNRERSREEIENECRIN